MNLCNPTFRVQTVGVCYIPMELLLIARSLSCIRYILQTGDREYGCNPTTNYTYHKEKLDAGTDDLSMNNYGKFSPLIDRLMTSLKLKNLVFDTAAKYRLVVSDAR